MIDLTNFTEEVIKPALEIIDIRDTREGRVMLYAIGLQESGFAVRRQHNNGPATGFWQFERGGGVRGVLNHSASKDKALALCKARNIQPTASAVWDALQRDDILAAGFARLLLLTDPKALPAVGDMKGSWEYYIRNWRPGKPHIVRWPPNYEQALILARK